MTVGLEVDLWAVGGYGSTRRDAGLQKDFGEGRVIDTPLAESAIVGTAIGLTMRGFRPVIEIQFDGFVYPAYDQIVSQVAKLHFRSQGRWRGPAAQMSGGTFTITNIGVFGVDAGTPILNPGESGILALGSIERRPRVDDQDQIVPRWVTTLALSFDHRVVDGEQGSRFLAEVASILSDPTLALTY